MKKIYFGTQMCSHVGCKKKAKTKDLCSTHYSRFLRYGSTEGGRHHDRVRYIVLPNGCWEWQLHKNKKGYGTVWDNGRTIGAHILEWVKINGPVPVGCQLDHTCRNTSCCNPYHLEPVTCIVNVRRSSVPKITVEVASQIKACLLTLTCKGTSEKLGVSIYIVKDISKGRTWKDA